MKKLLIPVIGLFALIIATPFILAKLANSNIDTRIANMQKKGIIVKELKTDIGYLNTNRVFEVEFNKETNQTTWNVYKKYVDTAKFKVNLSFKNLPITTAKMDIVVDNIKAFNQNFLTGFKLYVTSKNFKTFNYHSNDYKKDINIIGLNGIFVNKKYANNTITIKQLKSKLFDANDLKVDSIVKDLKLGIVDIKDSAKIWKIKYNDLIIKGKNSAENLSVNLSGDNVYTIKDNIHSDVFAVQTKNQLVGLANLDSNLTATYKTLKNSKYSLNLKWDKTEYQKVMLGGGDVKLKFNITNNKVMINPLKYLNLTLDIRFDKDLFMKLSSKFDPKMVNKFFKNYKSHIKIKNGVVIANGNRIQ